MVYTLQQQIYAAATPGVRYESNVFFMTNTEAELDELIGIYRAGKEDDRIVEQRLPPALLDRPGIRVRLLSLNAPDGSDLSSRYPDLPWAKAANERRNGSNTYSYIAGSL